MKALLFDVETINTKDKTIFDFSYAIIDMDKLEIIETQAYVIEEGFEKIDKAYFSKNKDKYINSLEVGTYTKIKMIELRPLFNKLVSREDIKYIMAFNIKFDIGAVSYSFKKYAKSKKDISYERLSKFVTILDIGVVAATMANLSNKYKEFCLENNLTTAKGNLKTTAEAFYAFITKNPLHEEEHIGIQDVMEEFEIFKHFYLQLNKKKSQDSERLFNNILKMSYEKKPFWKIVN